MIYLACSLVPLTVGLVLPQINQRSEWKAGYLVCIFGVFALILGLRGEDVGIDTEAYSRYFGYLADHEDFMSIVNSAPLYSLISRLLYFICTDAQVVLMFQAIVTCASVAYFIFVFSSRVEISSYIFVALYFYENAFNGARQMCAAALCCAAIACACRKHRAASAMLTICALGIHVVSIVMLPFILLSWWKDLRDHIVIVAAFVSLFVVATAVMLRPLLELITLFLPGYQQYLVLLDDPAYLTQGRNVLQGLFFLLISVADCVLILCDRTCSKADDSASRCKSPICSISIAALFGSLWATVFFWNSFLGPRIAWFPTLTLVVIIPDVLSRAKRLLGQMASEKHERRAKAISVGMGIVSTLILACCLALQVIQLVGNYSGVIPYYPFWID